MDTIIIIIKIGCTWNLSKINQVMIVKIGKYLL